MLSTLAGWFKRTTGQDAALTAIVLIFFVGMLPVAASRVVDTLNFERYYHDAAVSMVQANDFLTPRFGDGSLRLRKPPLIYWLLIASYKLLGISFFSTRICFLIAGCATIWLASKLALKLTDDIRTARATALILLSNLLLIIVSARATPDVLVTFWVLLSAYGFIRLICFNDRQALAYWCAYGGAALGVATKGLLPLIFVFYALVSAYFSSSPERPFRRMFHVPIILASILISCFGLILMSWKHGPLFLQSFWGDQFGEKTGWKGSPLRVTAYLLIYFPFLLPWLLCLAWLFYKREPERRVTAIQRKACFFILIWAALLPIIFGLGDRIQDRYLLPAIPLLAVVMAIGLCRFSDSIIADIADRLLSVVWVAFFALGIFGLSVLWQNGLLAKHLAGLTILSLALLLIALHWQRKQLSSQAVLSVSLFLFLPLGLAIMSPFTLPDQTTQIARALRSLNPEKRPVFVIGRNKVASRLRISNAGEYPVYQAKVSDFLKTRASSSQSIFVLTEGDARHLPDGSVQLREIAAYPSQVSLVKLLSATVQGKAKSYIENRQKHCYAVLPGSTATGIP
jgi:4-amino-4-deoxy-L-arabinose transferase-like glycosyltransferase